MDFINFPPLVVENKRQITEHCNTIGKEHLPGIAQMCEGFDGGILAEFAMNRDHLPIYVISQDYEAENIYCMTVKIGDAVIVPDTYDQTNLSYKFAVNVATRSKGWISVTSLEG